MMSYALEYLRTFEDKQVRMRFGDGLEVVATLLSVSQDVDESIHHVYDKIIWSNDPHLMRLDEGTITHDEDVLESIQVENA